MRVDRIKKTDVMLITGTIFFFAVLYIIQLNNYLLFHVFAEVFSIVIAFCVFIIVWNGRNYLKDNYLLLLGLAYLFIGFIDLLHVAGFPGMNIFQEYDYHSNQFWIAGRSIEALSFLSGILLLGRTRTLPVIRVLIVYTIVTIVLTYSILFSDIFPLCYIEVEGQTLFKIISEYVIIFILLLTLFISFMKRRLFVGYAFLYILLSILFTIVSEVAFTFYISNYGFSNMVGHYAKIVSFYFIYRAIIRKNIIEPYDSIFSELNERSEKLNRANELKTRLFSVISHDLRGPISGVRGVAGALDDDYDELTDEQRKTFISELRRTIDVTEAMVENLLAWSKVELHGYEPRKEVYNLELLLNEALKPLRPSLLSKNVEILIDNYVEHEVFVNRATFLIVVRNILSNALKFSESGSVIKISEEAEGPDITIRIEDSGMGMDFSPGIFLNPVNYSTPGTENEKGSGLGLYLINKYTIENGGTLNIQSSPGSGTIVTLGIPRSPC